MQQPPLTVQHSTSQPTTTNNQQQQNEMYVVPYAPHLRAEAACGLSLIIAPRFFRGFFFRA
jgi:hypothetical protein